MHLRRRTGQTGALYGRRRLATSAIGQAHLGSQDYTKTRIRSPHHAKIRLDVEIGGETDLRMPPAAARW